MGERGVFARALLESRASGRCLARPGTTLCLHNRVIYRLTQGVQREGADTDTRIGLGWPAWDSGPVPAQGGGGLFLTVVLFAQHRQGVAPFGYFPTRRNLIQCAFAGFLGEEVNRPQAIVVQLNLTGVEVVGLSLRVFVAVSHGILSFRVGSRERAEVQSCLTVYGERRKEQ